MKFEHTSVFNIESALRGMRNPKNSWDRSDSAPGISSSGEATDTDVSFDMYNIGPNDMKLAQGLISGGPVHSKFLRQIFVSVDITAPLYWWSEMDTYKVSTTANSCSTMHKLHDHAFTLDDFQADIETNTVDEASRLAYTTNMTNIINSLNDMRDKFIETKNYDYIRTMKRLLPTSYLQKRTWTCTYEVLRNIYTWRRAHRLAEWRVDFCDWLKTLPYFKEFIEFKNIVE